MEKRKFYIMCGVPGSGKSTWIRNHFPEGKLLVSRDAIRFALVAENEPYFSREDEVVDRFNKEIVNFGMMGDVIIDATHSNRASRKKVLDLLVANFDPEMIEVYFIYLNTSYEECIARNNQRQGRAKVPRDAIDRMWARHSTPSRLENPIIVKGVWIVEE